MVLSFITSLCSRTPRSNWPGRRTGTTRATRLHPNPASESILPDNISDCPSLSSSTSTPAPTVGCPGHRGCRRARGRRSNPARGRVFSTTQAEERLHFSGNEVHLVGWRRQENSGKVAVVNDFAIYPYTNGKLKR